MTADPEGMVHQLRFSPKLRQRRFVLLPLRGQGTPFTELQGRVPGDTTAPADLVDLISSISSVGVLQPVLVEEIPTQNGKPPAMRLAAGERRLRACRWGAVHQPENPHFTELPAIICPGPLSDEERRIWQLVENLARENLRPGELAAALVLDRCAVLLGKLVAAGHVVPQEVYALDDPMARFAALERIRGSDTACAAPWSEVLSRLGLQLSPRKVRELVRAFAEMPREICEEMDEAKISLHARIRFVELHRGRSQAAEEIWAAVKDVGRAPLLTAALNAAVSNPDIAVEQALSEAERLHEEANVARANKLRRDTPEETTPSVAPDLVGQVLTSLRALVRAVAAGARLGEHDRASVRLLTDQLIA